MDPSPETKGTSGAAEIPPLGIAKDLPEPERALLGYFGEFLTVPAGATLIEEGQPQDSLFFLISGLLHVRTMVDDKSTLIDRIEPGESIGEINIFDPGVASATVSARTHSQVWRVSRNHIETFIAAHPGVGARLLAGILTVMSRRVRHMNEKFITAEMEASARRMLH